MIEVEDLVKRHGTLEVLRGVTLRVPRGEVAAIIGPSGGGKSTILRCLNGLEPFQGGTVTVDGKDERAFVLCQCPRILHNGTCVTP